MLVILFSIFLLIGLIIAASCYGRLVVTIKKYSKYESTLDTNGITFVSACIQHYNLNTKVGLIDGELTDAYLIKKDIIALSKNVAYGKSVADIAIAGHEFGHAMQKKDKSGLLKLDLMLNTLARIANFFLPIALISALVLFFIPDVSYISPIIFYISIGLWFLTLLFRIVTIPLEIDASKRAYKVLSDNKLFTKKELRQTKKVLNAAALTYVGGLFINILKLFRAIKSLFRRD